MYYTELKNLGKSLFGIDANNTHSGNIAISASNDNFYITSSGSMKWDLKKEQIVKLKLSKLSKNDKIASVETPIHRAIIKETKSKISLHTHQINAINISLDSKNKKYFLSKHSKNSDNLFDYIYKPKDVFGKAIFGDIIVSEFKNSFAASCEMVKRIPLYLQDRKITIVQGHGPFFRAISAKNAFNLAATLEDSTLSTILMSRYGIHRFNLKHSISLKNSVIGKKVTTSKEFEYWANYNYKSRCGANGSMSKKISKTKFIFSDTSSSPTCYFPKLKEFSIDFDKGDSTLIKIHKLIYQNCKKTHCIINSSPMITTLGSFILFKSSNCEKTLSGETEASGFIKPIDVESIALYPKFGVLGISVLKSLDKNSPLLEMLKNCSGCCVVSSFGLITYGNSFEECEHSITSAKRCATFINNLFINKKIIGKNQGFKGN